MLKIKQTLKSDIYDFYCKNRDEEKNIGIACIPNLRTSKLVRSMFIKEEDKNNIYVMCKYNDKFKKYEPISLSETKKLTDLSKLKM